MEGEAQNPQDLIRAVSTPMFRTKGWLRFVGVMSIIYGILAVFTIWGILIAWLPIWMGVLLFQAAGAVEMAYTTGDQEQLVLSLDKIRLFFVLTGITTLVSVVIAVLAVIAAIMIPALLMSGGM